MGTNPQVFNVSPGDITQIIEMMSEDKSNDWSEEILVLTRVEAALDYAKLGQYTAALIGSHTVWHGADIIDAIAEFWERTNPGLSIGGQEENELTHWRQLADALGIDYSGDPGVEFIEGGR